MIRGRNVVDAREQSMYGQPVIQFRPNDFNAAIWSHGYDVICEQAVRCPCEGSSGAPLPDCQNCHGFGYFFINPMRTKALITGLNRNTNYVQWSPELIGTASITVRDEDRRLISYFNRITVEDESAFYTEMSVVRDLVMDGQHRLICFLTYAPIDIGGVYLYRGSDRQLVKLGLEDYSIAENNPYCLVINDALGVQAGDGISVSYEHRVEYHVIDLPHEIRSSLGRDKASGQFEILRLPIQGICRRSHLVLGKPDYDGSGIIYNDDAER